MPNTEKMSVVVLPLASQCPVCDRHQRNHDSLLAHLHRYHRHEVKIEKPGDSDRAKQRLRKRLEEDEMHRGWPTEAWAKICAEPWTAGPIRHAIATVVRQTVLPKDEAWFSTLIGEELVDENPALFPTKVEFAEHFLVGMQIINENGGYDKFMEMQDIRKQYSRLLRRASNEAQKERLVQLYPEYATFTENLELDDSIDSV